MSFIHVMQHGCFNKRAIKATVWLVSVLTATSLPPHHFLSVKNKQKAGVSVFSKLQSSSNFHMHDHGDSDNERWVREPCLIIFLF